MRLLLRAQKYPRTASCEDSRSALIPSWLSCPILTSTKNPLITAMLPPVQQFWHGNLCDRVSCIQFNGAAFNEQPLKMIEEAGGARQ